jgi:hypothetical protein
MNGNFDLKLFVTSKELQECLPCFYKTLHVLELIADCGKQRPEKICVNDGNASLIWEESISPYKDVLTVKNSSVTLTCFQCEGEDSGYSLLYYVEYSFKDFFDFTMESVKEKITPSEYRKIERKWSDCGTFH